MEEFTVDEVRQLQRQAKRKKAQGMNKAERIVEAYLRATRPHALQIAYEGMTVYLGGITYTPDFVVVMPGHNREYVEVKEADGDWKGHNLRETKAKLHFLRHVAENFGHRVYIITVEDKRVRTVVEIMP